MGIHPLFGHSEARKRLAGSLRAGRLPQVILVTGPSGIGKQRLSLWLAQLCLCEASSAGEPCGRCRSCHLVEGLSHPDVHWFIPIPRPKAGEPDKQVEEAAELLAEAVAARRESPLYQAPDGMHLHSMASARLLLRRGALTSVEGKSKIFLIGEADRLAAQEGEAPAANALLKFLEEPPAGTRIVLTTTEPERVLPTLRSRAVPLRLARLPDAVVRDFAATRLDPPAPAAGLEAMVRRAEGAIGRLAARGDEEAQAALEARALLEAVEAKGAARFERSLRQAPWAARGGFTDLLDALAVELSERARAAAAGGGAAPYAVAMSRVQEARVMAQGNVNPQLLLAALTADLARVAWH